MVAKIVDDDDDDVAVMLLSAQQYTVSAINNYIYINIVGKGSHCKPSVM